MGNLFGKKITPTKTEEMISLLPSKTDRYGEKVRCKNCPLFSQNSESVECSELPDDEDLNQYLKLCEQIYTQLRNGTLGKSRERDYRVLCSGKVWTVYVIHSSNCLCLPNPIAERGLQLYQLTMVIAYEKNIWSPFGGGFSQGTTQTPKKKPKPKKPKIQILDVKFPSVPLDPPSSFSISQNFTTKKTLLEDKMD